ncbi:MAG TPA: YCF48-related protein [Pyrinomonadaceae bacterium]|jgi:photosystem II stability/assembly factor-like uncharacterized protein
MKTIKKLLILFVILLCFQGAKANWVKQNANTFAWLLDVYFLNEKTGWISGSGGTLLATTDGGKTWKKQTGITEDTIRQIYFSDAQNGWLLCERNIFNRGSNSSSYILRTSDGGANWERMEIVEEGRERIVKIFFDGKNNSFAIGESGALYALPSYEDKWRKRASPIRYLLLDGIFTDASHGIIVGAGGTIIFTEDAGATWNKSNVFGNAKGKFQTVFFVNQKTGWAAGADGRIFQTVSGGKTWREQKSGVTTNLTGISFINSKEGWAVGEQGTILQTTTAGSVWTPYNSKIRHKLEKIFFVGKKGWIVGFGGTILSTDEEPDSAQKPILKGAK